VSEPVRTPCSAGDRITVAHDVPSNTISFRCKRGEVHRLVALGPNQDAYVHCMKDGGRGEAAAFAGVGPIWGEAKVLYGCQPGHRRGGRPVHEESRARRVAKVLGGRLGRAPTAR
jgi:hypothetical protein